MQRLEKGPRVQWVTVRAGRHELRELAALGGRTTECVCDQLRDLCDPEWLDLEALDRHSLELAFERRVELGARTTARREQKKHRRRSTTGDDVLEEPQRVRVGP